MIYLILAVGLSVVTIFYSKYWKRSGEATRYISIKYPNKMLAGSSVARWGKPFMIYNLVKNDAVLSHDPDLVKLSNSYINYFYLTLAFASLLSFALIIYVAITGK